MSLTKLQEMHRRAQKAEGQLQWVLPKGTRRRWDKRDAGLASVILRGVPYAHGREGWLANKASVLIDVLRLAREELKGTHENLTSPAIEAITPIVDYDKNWRKRMGLPPTPETEGD